MSEPSRDLIMKALEGVIDPELRRPVTELDMVRDVEIDGGDVRVTIALTVAGCPLRDSFQQQVVEVMRDVPGVERVALGFEVMTAEERQALTTKLRGGMQERSKGLSLSASTRVLAVCSGKGGVGKSTRRGPPSRGNVRNWRVGIQSGMPFGACFWKNTSPSIPCGYRFIVNGRSFRCGTIAGPTWR